MMIAPLQKISQNSASIASNSDLQQLLPFFTKNCLEISNFALCSEGRFWPLLYIPDWTSKSEDEI